MRALSIRAQFALASLVEEAEAHAAHPDPAHHEVGRELEEQIGEVWMTLTGGTPAGFIQWLSQLT